MSQAWKLTALISDEYWGVAWDDEAAIRDHGVSSLSMGMEREDTCE